MSIGLASIKIAEYTSNISGLTEELGGLENQAIAIAAAGKKDDPALKDLNKQIAVLKAIISMMKDFLEFWKDVIKSVLSLFKLFNELSRN